MLRRPKNTNRPTEKNYLWTVKFENKINDFRTILRQH